MTNTVKFFLLPLAALLILGVFLAYYAGSLRKSEQAAVQSFEECAAAGYPVGESYPRQCWTPDGRHFVEKIPDGNTALPAFATLSGEITCLPKRGSGAQTLECAIGLKAKDGKYYALQNLFELDPAYQFSATGKAVEVSGRISEEDVRGPDGNAYDIVGVIRLETIKAK